MTDWPYDRTRTERMEQIAEQLRLWLDVTVKLPAYYRRGIPLAEIRLLLHERSLVQAAIREILEDQGCPTAPCPHWVHWHAVAHSALASVDTRPEGGDATEIAAPFTGGAVPKADAQ